MFDQKQIAEFKEAFTMFDHDSDGFLDREDIKDMLSSLGQTPTDAYIDSMIKEAPGSINFTMFLTLMGEKMSGTDPEHEILQAFECFDDEKTGYINSDLLREYMTTMGDRFTDEEVDIMLKGSPMEDNDFNYRDFVRVLKHGETLNASFVTFQGRISTQSHVTGHLAACWDRGREGAVCSERQDASLRGSIQNAQPQQNQSITGLKHKDANSIQESVNMEDSETANHARFFRILGLAPPSWAGGRGTVADLDQFFDIAKLGLAQNLDGTSNSPPSVNPYDPPESCEKLFDWRSLDETSFKQKVSSLGSSILFVRPSVFFKKHYEIGASLVVEESARPGPNQPYPKFHIYRFFDNRGVMNQLLAETVLFVVIVVIMVMGYLHVFVFKGDSNDSRGAVQDLERFLENWQTFAVSILCSIALILFSILWVVFGKDRGATGLLKYLRDFSKPGVEEVMISYSWEAGITETARGIARCMLTSGLGVWIDHIKLTTGDKTSKTTRTIAAHARFVVIILTEKYLASAACFIEILAALSAPNAKERLIFYVPRHERNTENSRVSRLSAQLYTSGLAVIGDFQKLVTVLNEQILESTTDANLIWWQKYAGRSSGIPSTAIVPRKEQAPKLHAFKIWGRMHSIGRGCVNISNIWIAGDCRTNGTDGVSFPWVIVCYVLLMAGVIADMVHPKKRSKQFANNVSGYDITWEYARIAFQAYLLLMMIFIFSLGGFEIVDNRKRMHPSLRPLLSVSNFRGAADKGSKQEAKPSGSRNRTLTDQANSIKKAVGHVLDVEYFSLDRIKPSMPLVKVAMIDFGSGNTVAASLQEFYTNLGLCDAYQQERWLSCLPESQEIIYVPVFVFGGGVGSREEDEEELARHQLDVFASILKRKNLHISDCVLILANSDVKRHSVLKGFFNYRKGDIVISDYLFLIENAFTDNGFASEVILQTGLRVKNALTNFGRRKASTAPSTNV
ncbi:hypothetical protein HDU81_007206 [Chytriomyces hyalinus]|nr:hypothetical protein HDU81_007206 [Chytriomyces hyalinus]